MISTSAPPPIPIPVPVVIEGSGFDWSVLVPAGAIVAAIVTSLITTWNANRQLALAARQLELSRRASWWERFTWATERVLHPRSDDDAEFGLTVLLAMNDDPEAGDGDAELAVALRNHVLDTRSRARRGRRRR